VSKKADHPLRPLERLDQSVQQDPIEATTVETNVVLVVLVKRVHQGAPADLPSAG
jgi:hypothetical protein